MQFLNPLEMANPDKATVVDKVRGAAYAGLFRQVFGQTSLDDTEQAYVSMAQAIAAFERTSAFAPSGCPQAGLSFTAIQAGTGSFGLAVNSFGDGSGDPLPVVLADPPSVSTVPIPAAIWLFGSALAGLGVFGRRRDIPIR